MEKIVNYKADGSMESILDLINKSSSNKISGETFTQAVRLKNMFKNTQVPADLSAWGESLINVDDSFKTLVTDIANNNKSVEDLDVYIKKANMSTGTFAAGIKSIGANIGIMLAVTLAIKGAMYAWDKLNTTLEEQQEIVDKTKNKLEDYKSQLEELQKNGVSDAEKDREEYLKRMIGWYDEMYKSEMKAYYSSQLFGKGDLMSGGVVGENSEEFLDYSNLSTDIDNVLKKREEINNKLDNGEPSLLASILYGSQDAFEKSQDQFNKDLESGEKDLIAYKEKLTEALTSWNEDREKYQTALDSGLFSGQDKTQLENAISNLDVFINSAESNLDKINLQLGISVDEDEVVNALSTAIEDAANADYSSGIKAINDKLTDGLSSLSDVYDKVINEGSIDFNDILSDDFIEKFGSYDEEYNNFVQTLANSPKDINACKNAFDELAFAYVNGTDALKELNEENKDAVVAMLEQKGVSNASEVVSRKLAQAKLEELASTGQLVDMTETEIATLLQENYGLQLNEQMLKAVALAKQTVNGTSLNFNNDIAAIIAEVQGLGGVITSLSMVAQAKEMVAQGSGHWSGMSDVVADAKQEIQNAINSAMDIKVNFTAPSSVSSGGGSSSGGSSGSDKSKVDPYKAEIDALKDYTDAYEAAQAKREAIEKKYDNATTNEEKLKLSQQRIDAMYAEQKAIEDLNTARDEEIQKKVSQLQGQGFEVSYDATADNLHISNMEHLNELKAEDQETTNDLIQEYENIIKDTQDMADANKDLSVTWQNNVYSIRGYSDEIKKLKQEIVSEKISNAEFLIDMLDSSGGKESQIISLYKNIATEANNALEEALAQGLNYTDEWVQTILSKLNDVGSKIKAIKVQLAQDEVDKNNNILAGISAIVNEKIDALNEEKEALEKLNDEQDRAIKLSQLKEELDKARSQKTIYTYRKGTGWQYELDQDAIKTAKQNIAEYNNEQEIKAIEDEIQSWQDYLDKWNDIPTEYENAQNILIAKQELGRDIEKKILDQRIDIIDDFKDRYEDSMEELKEIQDTSVDDMLKNLGVLENIQAAMSTSKGKHYYANANGNAPNGATIGDYIHTNAGTYKIVEAGTYGASPNAETGLWSIKVDNVNASITDAIAGTEILTDTLSSNNSNLSTVSFGLDSNSYSNDDNTDATEDNTESNEELSEDINGLSSQLKNGITVNGTNSSSGNSGSLSDINLSEDGFKAGLEILKKTVGEDSQMYKDAVKYYNNLYPNSNSSSNSSSNASSLPVIGSMDSVAKSKSVAESSSYDEYFSSFNTKKISNKFYEFLDDAGRTVSATEDWFKTNYVLNNPDGYTDRERASSILSKAEETGYLETLMKYYPDFTKRQYDIDNTEVGGDVMVTQAARESAQRIYDEILNDVGSSVGGSYDSSGKKVISYSYDRNGDLVDTGYSKNALDFSDLDITVAPSDKDIYESPIYKAVKEAYLSSPDYEGDKGTNPDTVRAYDSSANNVYDSLKLETQKNGEETKSNSERLYENSQALQSLGEEFGDGIYDLVDAANGVVKVIDTQNGNIVGAINTKNGSVYRNGSSSSGGSSGGLYSSDGTYGTYYSKEDQEAILQYQNDYNKAIAEGNQSAADAAHQAANEIRKLYDDIADEAGKIISSSSSSKSYTISGKTVTVSNNGKTVTVTSAHARGIRRVKKDELSALGEEGQELLINNPYGGVPTLVGEGSTVFNADATSEAYDFLNDPQTYIGDILKNIDLSNFSIGNDLFSGLSKVSTPIIPTTNNNSSSVYNIKAEFPNATNADEIKKALESIGTINNLPQLSTQRGYSNLM